MLLPKDTDWLNRYENKTCIYAFYQTTISNPGTHTDWRDGKKDIPFKWKFKESWSSNILSDKIDFKIKIVTRDKKNTTLWSRGQIKKT